MDNDFFFLTIVMILHSLLLMSFGILIGINVDKIVYTLTNEESEFDSANITHLNLSLEDTAEYLNSKVKSIFKYNITDDNIKLTYEDLVRRGGDCKNWAEYYKSLARDTNFYSENYRMRISNKTNHVINIISDSTGYCVMDQRNYKCFRFKQSKPPQ